MICLSHNKFRAVKFASSVKKTKPCILELLFFEVVHYKSSGRHLSYSKKVNDVTEYSRNCSSPHSDGTFGIRNSEALVQFMKE